MLTDSAILSIAATAAHGFELAGIAIIIVGSLVAGAQFALAVTGTGSILSQPPDLAPVPAFRRTLGRSILTGLEMLVAADIILTVGVEPTVRSVLVLGGIVLIRTFLSFSLEVEIEGRWPWQGGRGDS
ncbi:MAG: DUF1622 domain-containing protein [Porphyrobacter sp.]|nr:DUF1622 domain-containing protein [Porphyrobacter sp.]